MFPAEEENGSVINGQALCLSRRGAARGHGLVFHSVIGQPENAHSLHSIAVQHPCLANVSSTWSGDRARGALIPAEQCPGLHFHLPNPHRMPECIDSRSFGVDEPGSLLESGLVTAPHSMPLLAGSMALELSGVKRHISARGG